MTILEFNKLELCNSSVEKGEWIISNIPKILFSISLQQASDQCLGPPYPLKKLIFRSFLSIRNFFLSLVTNLSP